MNWKVLGSDEQFEIQDTDAHRRVANLRHCTLTEARLMAQAPALQDALAALIEACEGEQFAGGGGLIGTRFASREFNNAVEAARDVLEGVSDE